VPTPAYTSLDGPRITVDGLLKNPAVLPALLLEMSENEFIVDAVLRDGGITQSGAVRYWESTPLYADSLPEIRAEGAEVPLVPTSVGTPRAAFAAERAFGIRVTDEMRRRQLMDPVTRMLTQLQNTMVLAWDNAFYTAITTNASVQTLAVSNPWASSNATIRADIANGKFLVNNASITSGTGFSQYLGFQADTLIINQTTENTLFQSDAFSRVYLGDLASENLEYTGVLPNQVMSLDVMRSRQLPVGTAIIMQRGRCGAITDELPMVATPLYRDEPRKSWRTDLQRSAAISLDQPLAIAVLSGV